MKSPQSLSNSCNFELVPCVHSIHSYYSMSQENYRSYHRRGWGYGGGGGGGGLDAFAIYMIIGIAVLFLFCACIAWLVLSFTQPCL